MATLIDAPSFGVKINRNIVYSIFSFHSLCVLSSSLLVLYILAYISLSGFPKPIISKDLRDIARDYWRFFVVSFLKPHTGDDSNGQQSALESFYGSQAQVYDRTRGHLLRGREEMLALVAAQMRYQVVKGTREYKPVWVDLGGGTGWNIEAITKELDVPNFFSAVYLVDFSPSLCDVARSRFKRLGWANVTVLCQDARLFNLAECKADLITMSYSLSMIPSFHVVIDTAVSLLVPKSGIIAVVDFYVQSVVETSGRNYMGCSIQRHVNWLGRTFWRAWFDLDRVSLDGARRDYLEYRFGTLKAVNDRNYILGYKLRVCIPYYIFLGRHISSVGEDLIERLDANITEPPYQSTRHLSLSHSRSRSKNVGSKSPESAIVNLSVKPPLASAYYQNDYYRIAYAETLQKHTRFQNDFIYAFTWEDSQVDLKLLNMASSDVVLCITSAGDNVLDYIFSSNPRRVHAVDLNPNQNHLLELKVAAYQALQYHDFWKLFGEGKHSDFQTILIHKLSPYLSSHAFEYWLNRQDVFTSEHGLYEHGGSGQAVKLVRLAMWICGLTNDVKKMCSAKTLDEQRQAWPRIRRILMSRGFHWAFLGSSFWWRAAGVPPNQVAMIQEDYLNQEDLNPFQVGLLSSTGEAMWQYLINTLDPVASETLLSEDNFYYLLTLTGKYTRRCHPNYLSATAHIKLSKPGAFNSLRIHTDEISEVIERLSPGTLTIAVVMDSMDWFDHESKAAANQIRSLNTVLTIGGRVLLRSASLMPWYVKAFGKLGFSTRRVSVRLPGSCIDSQYVRLDLDYDEGFRTQSYWKFIRGARDLSPSITITGAQCESGLLLLAEARRDIA